MKKRSVQIKDGYYMEGHKFKLYPSDSQKEFINTCINTSRFVFNWALASQKEHYDEYLEGKYDRKFYSTLELQKELTKFRHQKGNEWLLEVPNESLRCGVLWVNKGITMACSTKSKNHFPQFKLKKKSVQSYKPRHDRLYIKDGNLRIEGFPPGEMIDMHCHINYSGKDDQKIYNPIISLDNMGNYWISFNLMVPKKVKAITFDKDNVIGIDLNVKDRFVCSNGYRSGSPNIYKYKRLRSRYQRKYEKDKKRMKQWEKTNPGETYVKSKRELKREKRYKKARKKIANVVENFIQVETKRIIDMNPSTVVMEHIDNLSILSKHHVAKLTMESAFYRCRQVMQNKCNKFSIPFILAPRSYPSSQLCSNCGSRYKIGTSKIYKCKCCGLEIDRDLNAALNLKKLAYT